MLWTVLALTAATPASAGAAHEHGVARLDIAVDAGRISLQLDTPLDNLLGFERAPRSDAERNSAAAAVATLRAAERLFRIDPAAGCKLVKVELVSAALNLGAAKSGPDEHADMDASFEFSCQAADKATFVDVELFAAFARLARLEVQVAGAKAQSQTTLRRPAKRVALQR
jgi:hypothetical protein